MSIDACRQSIEHRRAIIRAELERAGYGVFGQPLELDGRRVMLRIVLPLTSGKSCERRRKVQS